MSGTPIQRESKRYGPHPELERLSAGGWTREAIALAVGASVREVYRWAGGYRRPIGVYEQMLAALPDNPWCDVPQASASPSA
jgi:hypothetical protein